MDESNPYAAPGDHETLVAAGNPEFAGLWRDRRDLVLHRDSRLPNLCVKTGQPTSEVGIKRSYRWHSPWLALAILVNLLLYIILAIALSHRATVVVPLAPDARANRRFWIIISWVIALTGIAIGCTGIYFLMDVQGVDALPIVSLFTGAVLLISGLIVGQNAARILRPTRITKTHVWFRGVHESILSQLPPLPPAP